MSIENEILENTEISPNVNRYWIHTPDIARARKAGQFVIVRIADRGERIPLTIADADPQEGRIMLIVQAVGKTTAQMRELKAGEAILDLVGPLGTPTHVEKFGTVVMVGGGIGIAPCHPIAQAMKAAGNRVISILGARNEGLIIMEEEMARASDEVVVCTDDGSRGVKGLVTNVIAGRIERGEKIDLVVAIGPLVMMKFVAATVKPHGIPCVVSLNPVMVDGTGMCGGCRVTVGDETKFVCVDGPEFDGHAVDFDLLTRRLSFYREQEKESYERFMAGHRCKLEAAAAAK